MKFHVNILDTDVFTLSLFDSASETIRKRFIHYLSIIGIFLKNTIQRV